MKVGLIVKNEKYWSLQKMNERILKCLEKKYEVILMHLEDNSIKKNQENLNKLYENCDVIIYMASKLITFKRPCDKPTFFFTYAWMDHGAGINFYFNKKTFGSNDTLLFLSFVAKNKFNQVYSTNMNSVVIPYFVTNKEIKLKVSEEKYLRTKYGIPENSKILMYFGRFSSEKNIEALFVMAKRIQNKNFVILAVGDFVDNSTFGFGEIDEKSYQKKTEEKIASESSGKIIFINKISGDELYRLLSIAFLTINPTLCMEENFSLSTIESMSAGVPVVASHWGGIKNIIINEQNGFLAKTFFSRKNKVQLDVDEMISYIDKALSPRFNREKISDSAIKQCTKLFSEAAFLKKITALLVSVSTNENNRAFIRPKQKYKLAYEQSLKRGRVKSIYLDNPWMFRELYESYLGG